MTEDVGRIDAIWVKRFKRGPMDSKEKVKLIAGRGIEGNANQGGKRQVTVLSADAWQTLLSELEADIDPAARRANVLVSGIDFLDTRGRVLEVGKVRLLIHGETRPCERMEEAHAGLQKALDPNWRGGAYGEVLDDGEISVGDPVHWSVS